jgi:hypothetical protein
MRNFLKVLFLLTVLIFLYQPEAVSARRLPFLTKTVPSSVAISPKLRSDRLALIVNFSNLTSASSLTYNLSYNSNGIAQGVGGTIKPTSASVSRELLFGTCSSGVCRYHTNITDMRFVVTTSLKSGGKLIKSYRVKP